MKGFTKNHKFVPMTDYKKVTRKSRDPKVKTHGVRMKRLTKFKNGDKIKFHGKNTILNTKLPLDRTGQSSVVSYSNQPADEEITYVVSKSDGDGHLFYHWENSKGKTISWTGREAGFAQSDLARRTSKFAFRTDYRNGIQFNLDPNEFGVENTLLEKKWREKEIQRLQEKAMAISQQRVNSTISGTPEETKALWEKEKQAHIELASVEGRTLREGFAES